MILPRRESAARRGGTNLSRWEAIWNLVKTSRPRRENFPRESRLRTKRGECEEKEEDEGEDRTDDKEKGDQQRARKGARSGRIG